MTDDIQSRADFALVACCVAERAMRLAEAAGDDAAMREQVIQLVIHVGELARYVYRKEPRP